MNGGRVARRYARAVFDLAVAQNAVDGWLGDLLTVQGFLDSAGVRALLENPEVAFAQKQEVVDQGLAQLSQLARNFVYVLVQHGRVGAIDDIVAEFRRLVNDYHGIAVATVTTAVPLEDKESQEVARRLEALVGKRIVLEKRVDPGILGGVVARIGDHVIDGSLASQLNALRDNLAG